MGAWNSQASFRLDREGKPSRSFDVRARRYSDGAFVACVRAPSLCGDTTHRIELDPRAIEQTRAVMRATSSQLRTSLRAGVVPDSVGHLWDIVGVATPTIAAPLRAGVWSSWDIVGDLQSTLRGALGGIAPPAQTGQGVGLAALGGLLSGGTQGAAQGAMQAIGGAMGMSPEQAQDIAQRLAGKSLPITDPAELQARRDRALRELALVIAQGTHPLGSANWAGAINYHLTNLGLTVPEWTALGRDQAVLASLPRVSPFIGDASLQEGPRTPTSTPTSTPLSQSLATIQQRALGGELVPPLNARSIVTELQRPLTGVAGESSNASASLANAGASLGASEVLARALASMALESSGASSRELAHAADIARLALRTVDATAGARVGDPRARAAIRDAINASSDRVARGLRIGLALVGGQ